MGESMRKFYEKHHRMPSYSEFARVIGVKSKNAVLKWVAKLEEAGMVRQDAQGRLSPRKLWGKVKVLGVVEAGFATGAEEETLDTLSLDEHLIGNREATYILRVKGDSMDGAGIREGDLVIVERGVAPRAGDIVIAQVDGGWTMKYYKKRGEQIILEAANDKYKPIIPKNELKIEAVVRAVVRKYA